MTQTITSPPLVSPTRPEGSSLDNKPAASGASKHEPRTDLKRIGTVSCPGVVHRYLGPLLERIHRHELDATFVISHRIGLDEVPEAYETFNAKAEGCVKVVIRPFS